MPKTGEEIHWFKAWLMWVFCPHSWNKVLGSHDIYSDPNDKYPHGQITVYQCSKCSRIKRFKT